MLDHAVPGVEGEGVVAVDAAGMAVALLRLDAQGGDGLVRGLLLVPQDGGVLHRHALRVGRQLRPQDVLCALTREEVGDDLADRGEVLHLHVLTGQGAHVLGRRGQRDLRDVVPVAQGALGEVRLAEDVGVVPPQALQGGAGGPPDGLHRTPDHARGARRQALQQLGGLGVLLQQAQHLLVAGHGAEGERREVHHEEVLIVAVQVRQQPLALHPQHLQGPAPRGGSAVGVDVPGCGGEPRHRLVGARTGEDALRQLGSQALMDLQRGLEDGVALGVGVAVGVLVLSRRAALCRAHLGQDLAGQVLLAVDRMLDVGRVLHRFSHQCSAFSLERRVRRAEPRT